MSRSSSQLSGSYEDLFGRAELMARSGDIAGAIEVYQRLYERLWRLSDRVLDRRSDLSEMRSAVVPTLIQLLLWEGRFSEAIEIKEGQIETDPEQAARYRRELASLQIQKGDVETGLAGLRAQADKDPGDIWTWIVLGAELRVEGRFAQSREALTRALEVGQEHDNLGLASVYYNLFLLYKEMGQLDQAVEAWENLVKVDPEAAESVRDVYAMLTDAGRYSQALEFVARHENPLEAGYQRGLIASLTGRIEQAHREWKGVAAMDPLEFEYGYDAWVESMLRTGEIDGALEWLQDHLSEHGSVRLMVLSGIGWAMKEDAEVASALFQQAIRMMRTERPPKTKLDGADWRLLDSLVRDEQVKTSLKHHFAVIETLW